MFKAIGCLAVFFFLVFIVLFKVLRNIFRALTGDDPSRRRREYHDAYRTRNEENTVSTDGHKPKKNVIPDDVGEYIDYEDVKKK